MASTIAQQIIDDYEEHCCECDDATEANEWLWEVLEVAAITHGQTSSLDIFLFKDSSVLEMKGNYLRLGTVNN